MKNYPDTLALTEVIVETARSLYEKADYEQDTINQYENIPEEERTEFTEIQLKEYKARVKAIHKLAEAILKYK